MHLHERLKKHDFNANCHLVNEFLSSNLPATFCRLVWKRKQQNSASLAVILSAKCFQNLYLLRSCVTASFAQSAACGCILYKKHWHQTSITADGLSIGKKWFSQNLKTFWSTGLKRRRSKRVGSLTSSLHHLSSSSEILFVNKPAVRGINCRFAFRLEEERLTFLAWKLKSFIDGSLTWMKPLCDE